MLVLSGRPTLHCAGSGRRPAVGRRGKWREAGGGLAGLAGGGHGPLDTAVGRGRVRGGGLALLSSPLHGCGVENRC